MSDTGCNDGCDELFLSLARLSVMLWYVFSSLALGLAGIWTYVYYLKKGQFEDPEDVKYQMFRDEEK